MSRVPEKWRELAKAEIDGAVIQWLSIVVGKWHAREYGQAWDEIHEYRIDPKCDYALAKIPEKHREVYLQWCDGAEIEYLSFDNEWIQDDPEWHDELDYRVKPKTVKRWQWVMLNKTKNEYFLSSIFFNDSEIKMIDWEDCTPIRPIEETMREFEV